MHTFKSDSSEVEYNQSTDESSETSPSLQIKNNGPNFEPVNKLKEKTSKQDDENIITKGTDESLVSEAIITGNIEAAVELCFEICRPADALIIASTVGNDFLTKTHERYLRTRDGDLSNIISALITRDWIEYVSHCSLDSWKKALVAILKHGDRKIIDICEILGDRLLASDSQIECKKNALLCYICAGNIDKTIDAWYQINSFEKNVKEHELDNSELQALAEIAIILSKSLEMQGIVVEPEGKFADLVYLYGTRLVDQGATNIAVSYVFALGPSIHPKLSELRDRLNEVVSPKSYTGTSKKLNVIGSESFNNKKMNYNAQPTVQDSTVFSQNMYNTGLPTGNQWNVPPSAIQSVAQALPSVNMFNPQLQVAHNFNQLLPQAPTSQLSKPPTVSQASETFMHPPRPSSVSSQGSIPLTSRPKYILDPSVSGGSQYGSSNYSGSYNQPQGLTQNNFNTMPITSSSMHPSPMHPNNPLQNNYNSFNSMQPPQNRFLPGTTPIETASLPPPQTYVQRNPTPPPGWNDPPVLKSSKQQNKKPEPSASVITHPIFGIDPNHNGYLDSNTHYQNQTNFLALGSNQQPTVQVPYNVTQPMQTNFQTTNLSPNMPQQHTGYAEQPATVQQRVPEAPKEKSALPEEFIYMQTVFEELKSQCLAAASDPRTKRKFVDVTKRLENLYDCLTDRRLTSNTIESLNQIVQFIQIGDYNNALATHTSIAFGTDFAQTSSFMPGIKVLIQSAADLKVLLR